MLTMRLNAPDKLLDAVLGILGWFPMPEEHNVYSGRLSNVVAVTFSSNLLLESSMFIQYPAFLCTSCKLIPQQVILVLLKRRPKIED